MNAGWFMKKVIAGLVVTLILSFVPAPTVAVENPGLLYAAAMYKAAMGDTNSAVRLVNRADQAQSRRSPHPTVIQSASARRALATIL